MSIRIVQAPLDKTIQTGHLACAAKRDELDLLRVARLKPNRRTGGDVQPHAVRRRTVKRETTIDLKKVAVGADLDWAIATIRDLDSGGGPSCVDLNVTGFKKVLSWNHVASVTRMGGPYRIG
jgi:hypothetical protein